MGGELFGAHSQEVNEIEREYDAVKQAYHTTRAELRASEHEKAALMDMVQRLRDEVGRLSDSLQFEQQRVVDIERSTRTHLDLIDREVGELHRSKQALGSPDFLNPVWVASPARGRQRHQGDVPSIRLSPRSIVTDYAEEAGRAALSRTSSTSPL